MSRVARTSISLPADLLPQARARAKAMRYRNLSAYIAALIEMDLATRGDHVLIRKEGGPGKPLTPGKLPAIPAAAAHAENPPSFSTPSPSGDPDAQIRNRLCEDPPSPTARSAASPGSPPC